MDVIFRGRNTKGKWVEGSLVRTTGGISHMPKQHTKTWIIQSSFGNGGWFNIMQRQYVKPDTIEMRIDADGCKFKKIEEYI